MISVFLSFPQPHVKAQEDFINKIKETLHEKGFEPRTLGVSDYDLDAPLKGIRKLMLESCGLLTVAFRRTLINDGLYKANSDLDCQSIQINNKWLTSPYCQIEPAMAFQIGLPVLILRENGVIEDGILEKGVLGTYMPMFNLSSPTGDYFKTMEWKQLIGKWENQVKNVYERTREPSNAMYR